MPFGTDVFMVFEISHMVDGLTVDLKELDGDDSFSAVIYYVLETLIMRLRSLLLLPKLLFIPVCAQGGVHLDPTILSTLP